MTLEQLTMHITIMASIAEVPRLCRNCRFWKKWESGDDADCLKFYPEEGEADYKAGNMARASYDDAL